LIEGESWSEEEREGERVEEVRSKIDRYRKTEDMI
jgi:hypothetical protein